MQYVPWDESHLGLYYDQLSVGQQNAERYRKHMKSEKWATIKAETFESVGRMCEICGATKGLVVHHRSYANIGHEGQDDLTVLCHACHHSFHEKQKWPFEHKETPRKRCAVCNGTVNLSYFSDKGGYSRGIHVCGRCCSLYEERLKREPGSNKRIVKKGQIYRKKSPNRSGREMVGGRSLSDVAMSSSVGDCDFEERLAKAKTPSWRKKKKRRPKKP